MFDDEYLNAFLEPVGDIINGHVYDEFNEFVQGATVSAVCDGGNVSTIDTTNDHGYYVVSIDCSFGSSVTVTAEKDGDFGTETGTMWGNDSFAITIVDVIMTPEFGLIAVPMMLSMMGFMFIRGKM